MFKTDNEKKTELTMSEYETLVSKIDKLQTEVWYNRIVMAIFLVIAIVFIDIKTDNIADVLSTFIEMFMP